MVFNGCKQELILFELGRFVGLTHTFTLGREKLAATRHLSERFGVSQPSTRLAIKFSTSALGISRPEVVKYLIAQVCVLACKENRLVMATNPVCPAGYRVKK